MAYVLNYYDWDRSGAEREFKRALELNTNHAPTHEAYGRFLASLGRLDEARARLAFASETNPRWGTFLKSIAAAGVLPIDNPLVTGG